MQTIFFEKNSEIKRTKEELEKKLNVKIEIDGRKVIVEGGPFEEYIASVVLDAMRFGFSAHKALILKDDRNIFRTVSIKDNTHKKKLKEVRARIIGKNGKTKKTIENITNCEVIINNNEVGIIGEAESIEEVITAVSNLVRGTKQSNTYKYLEKMNKRKKDVIE